MKDHIFNHFLDLGENNEKGERKTEENYIKSGVKGLWVICSNNFRHARRKLIRRGKNESLKREEEMIEMHNIYPCKRKKKINTNVLLIFLG